MDVGHGYFAVECNSSMVSPATIAVTEGNYLPAHDEVFDAAKTIGETLDQLHKYITAVRDEKQADQAVIELLTFLLHDEPKDESE